MYISKLNIKNFKCYNDIEIKFDPHFNLIIGENNSGKSTIFDALRLWQLAFQKFLKDRTNNQQSSFYAAQFFSFTIDDIAFLRISDFLNLLKNRSKKDFEISLTISNGLDEIILPIIFSKTTKGQVLNFQLFKQTNLRPDASKQLSKLLNIPVGSDFKEVFLFTYINPIFLLPNNEPLYSKGYILNKLRESKANEIIRNLLFSISPERKKIKKEPKDSKLVEIETDLKNILHLEDITFSKRLEDEDSFIKIFSKNEILNTEVEINQLGSGTINVLNILSVLAYGDYEKFTLNALLLDEPDSHLHFNLQNRLYKHLKKVSQDENKQIFIITHNSNLISQFEDVLFLDKKKKSIEPIHINNYLENYLSQINESQYNVMKELSESKKKQEEIEKQLKNITKPILYCEGSTDVTILEKAFFKLYEKPFFNNEIDIQDGNSAGGVGNFIKSNSKKDVFIIGLLDNDRAGQSQIKSIIRNIAKPFALKEIIENFHYQKFERNIGYNTHFLLLPIPKFRSDSADFFKNHLFIEYLFTDNVLKEKLGVEMFTENGTTYEKIKLGEDGKIHKSEKEKVIKNIDALKKEDFQFFIPLFDKIAEITKKTLPKNV